MQLQVRTVVSQDAWVVGPQRRIGEVRIAAHGHQDVRRKGQMEHLLRDDAQEQSRRVAVRILERDIA